MIISDNCSTDNLQLCCDNYRNKGLNVFYHRNEINLGPDGNFEWCLQHADGKYIWLLGSDDILKKGVLQKILTILESGDYGLIHLSTKIGNNVLGEYHSSDEMVLAVNYWITFMSANIIRTESLSSIDLSEYRQSFMIQVPAYLNACFLYMHNTIFYQSSFFESGSDNAHNGGYDIFEVFVTNLYGIYDSFIQKKQLSRSTFNKIIKIEFQEFLLWKIINHLVWREDSNFIFNKPWRRLLRYYWNKPYFYRSLLIGSIKELMVKTVH